MKTKISVLGLVCLFPLFALSQHYEVTEVDIFSLEKLPSTKEISVYGIRVGDSIEEVLAKLKKKRKDINYNGEVYSLDMDKAAWRVLSKDNKTVKSIIMFPTLSDRLKGKTAEFFKLLSPGRIKSFVEGCFGEPDYGFKSESEYFPIYIMYYIEEGFKFNRFFSSNSIELTTKEEIQSSIEKNKTSSLGKLLPKGKEVEEEIIPPKIVSKAGFRGVLWGTSKEQVKKVETSKIAKEDKSGGNFKGLDVLYYKTEIGTLEAVIVYYFAKNLLTRARYIIMESHSNRNMYIQDFKNIKSQLTQKYGAPTRDDMIWSNDLYKDDPSGYGMAVGVGHLMYVVEWYPPETTIQLILRGDNYKISLWVEYTGSDFMEFEEKVRKKAKKDIW